MKDKSMRTREEWERTHNLPFHLFYLNLFKTILIGLKLPTNLFYVWTEGHIPFRCFTGVINTGKTP